MLQNNHPCIETSAPGKVFILGEYAILAQLSAVVAAVPPRFCLRVTQGSNVFGGTSSLGIREFHPESPAGRLLTWVQGVGSPDLSGVDFRYEDPHSGKGGLGGSTAQFALVYAALAEAGGWSLEWESAWNLYRDLTAMSLDGQGASPSGADFVAQWKGGVTHFGYNGKGVFSEDLSSTFDWSQVLVLSAADQEGRKVPTHEHLARLKDSAFLSRVSQRLIAPLSVGIAAIRENQSDRLALALREYSKVLNEVGLEIEATTQDRQALQSLPGVLGVKGSGALQADALIVLLDQEATRGSALRQQVLEVAKTRHLLLVADGIENQKGIQIVR